MISDGYIIHGYIMCTSFDIIRSSTYLEQIFVLVCYSMFMFCSMVCMWAQDTSRLLKESTSEKISLKGLLEEYEAEREQMEDEVARRRAHAEVVIFMPVDICILIHIYIYVFIYV